MAVVHQSDLAGWNYCPARFAYDRTVGQGTQTSALAYGHVMHHALHTLERHRDLDQALATFDYYWHPLHIDQLTEPVPPDGWMPRHSYGELRKRGFNTLRAYNESLRWDDHELLALEYEFVVPLEGTDHLLAGTVDRLAVRWHKRVEAVCVDDFKTGAQKYNLRHNVQGSAYCYATTRPEFWTGAKYIAQRLLDDWVGYDAEGFGPERGTQLHERFADAPRRFTWINTREGRWSDGGYRGPIDYERLKLAVNQVAASVEAGIFPLRIDGETCTYCPHRSYCGEIGLPDDDHGKKVMLA